MGVLQLSSSSPTSSRPASAAMATLAVATAARHAPRRAEKRPSEPTERSMAGADSVRPTLRSGAGTCQLSRLATDLPVGGHESDPPGSICQIRSGTRRVERWVWWVSKVGRKGPKKFMDFTSKPGPSLKKFHDTPMSLFHVGCFNGSSRAMIDRRRLRLSSQRLFCKSCFQQKDSNVTHKAF